MSTLISLAASFTWSLLVSNMKAGKQWSTAKYLTVLLGGCVVMATIQCTIEALVRGTQ